METKHEEVGILCPRSLNDDTSHLTRAPSSSHPANANAVRAQSGGNTLQELCRLSLPFDEDALPEDPFRSTEEPLTHVAHDNDRVGAACEGGNQLEGPASGCLIRHREEDGPDRRWAAPSMLIRQLEQRFFVSCEAHSIDSEERLDPTTSVCGRTRGVRQGVVPGTVLVVCRDSVDRTQWRCSAMSDPIRERLGQLDIACRDLHQRLQTLRDATAEITTMRARGRSASEIVSGGPGVPARRELRETWSQVNAALHDYRVALVVSMIEDEGMSVSDVARVMGNARQVISRLYHSAET